MVTKHRLMGLRIVAEALHFIDLYILQAPNERRPAKVGHDLMIAAMLGVNTDSELSSCQRQ